MEPEVQESDPTLRRLHAYIRECVDAGAWPTAEEVMHIVSLRARESDFFCSPCGRYEPCDRCKSRCLCGRSPDPGIKPGGGCRCADTAPLVQCMCAEGFPDACKVHPAGWDCPHDVPLVWVYSECGMGRMLLCPLCRKEFWVANADVTEVCATGDHAACMQPGCECGCHVSTEENR